MSTAGERPLAEEHVWKEEGDTLRATAIGSWYLEGEDWRRANSDWFARFARLELLRVVAERDEACLQHQCSEATLAMVVARLGGLVEGRPTHRINFLQRIDQLVELERKVLVDEPISAPTAGSTR